MEESYALLVLEEPVIVMIAMEMITCLPAAVQLDKKIGQ